MQYQELQKYQLVESFLSLIRNTQSKQQFLNRVQEFDNRFTDDQNIHTFSEKHKSIEKLPPIPPEKPKNPFKTNFDDNNRHQPVFNNNQTAQNFHQINQNQTSNIPKGPYSRSQQNFYKIPSNAPLKTQYLNQGNQNYSYGGVNNPNLKSNQTQNYNYGSGNGMGVTNYNAYSQKEYDDLKQQFFRPPNLIPNDHYNKIHDNHYNMRNQDTSFNMNQLGTHLGMSSSTQLLGGPQIMNKPSARGYNQRINPFQRQ